MHSKLSQSRAATTTTHRWIRRWKRAHSQKFDEYKMHIEAGQWISVQSFFHFINNCVGLGHGGWRPTKNKNASQRATNEKKRSAHAHSHAIRFRRNWIVEKLRKFICAKTSKEDGGERGEASEREKKLQLHYFVVSYEMLKASSMTSTHRKASL